MIWFIPFTNFCYDHGNKTFYKLIMIVAYQAQLTKMILIWWKTCIMLNIVLSLVS